MGLTNCSVCKSVVRQYVARLIDQNLQDIGSCPYSSTLDASYQQPPFTYFRETEGYWMGNTRGLCLYFMQQPRSKLAVGPGGWHEATLRPSPRAPVSGFAWLGAPPCQGTPASCSYGKSNALWSAPERSLLHHEACGCCH